MPLRVHSGPREVLGLREKTSMAKVKDNSSTCLFIPHGEEHGVGIKCFQ